jgi:hypothetical protein
MFRNLKSACVALVLLASVVCLAVPAGADDAPEGAPGTAVVFDTPTFAGIPAEQEAQLRALLAPKLNRSDEGLVKVVAPDGTISMDPQGRFQTVVLARINQDGKLEIYSFDEIEPAMGFLTFEIPSPEPAPGTTAVE